MDKPSLFSENSTMRDGTVTTPKPSVSAFERARLALKTARSEMKENGLKGLIRRYGWKLFAFVFAYYLIRDLALYVVIPWLIARHLMT